MRADAIVKLADLLGVRASTPRTTYVLMECPLAPVTHKKGTDNTPSLSVLVKDGDRSGWICHSCGSKGTLPGLVVQWATYFAKDPGPALDLINQEENSVEAVCGRIDHKWDEKWKERDTAAVAGVDFEVFGEQELASFLGRVPRYIIDRGFSLETCKAWQLGFDKEWRDPDGNLRPRLTIPVRRKDGKLVGMVGRALDDDKKDKYWNYWHFHKSHYLFGQDRTEQEKPLVVVVEGYLDVMRWWEYGINVVATMGSHPSDEQIRLLSAYEDIFLAYDKDDAGFKGRDEIADRLKNRVTLWDTTFPGGKTDPKQLTRDEAEFCLLHSKKIL